MLVSETYINATKGWNVGEVEPYEPFTDDVGRLFRAMQQEYGRCVGSVYVDTKAGATKRIGWVFQKQREYEDTHELYLAETWVTLHDEADVVTRTHRYHTL